MLAINKCEKHSKKEEALAKLRDGAKFDEVAREFSEDKARQGENIQFLSTHLVVCILTPRLHMSRGLSGLEGKGESGSPIRGCGIWIGSEHYGKP